MATRSFNRFIRSTNNDQSQGYRRSSIARDRSRPCSLNCRRSAGRPWRRRLQRISWRRRRLPRRYGRWQLPWRYGRRWFPRRHEQRCISRRMAASQHVPVGSVARDLEISQPSRGSATSPSHQVHSPVVQRSLVNAGLAETGIAAIGIAGTGAIGTGVRDMA